MPANELQIMPMLAMLRLHFPMSNLSTESADLLMRDYLNDLSPYPPDIIKEACLEYRHNGQNLHFPKIGQLLELVKKRWYQRKYKLQKLKKLLGASNHGAQESVAHDIVI